jgi:predicted transcriptional regulator
MVLNQPAHKYNNYHTDPKGDILDENIDIVHIKSYEQNENIVLEMKVAGKIIDNNSMYHYQLNLVIKNIENENEEGSIIVFRYSNGNLSPQIDFETGVNDDILTIDVPKSYLSSWDREGYFIVGLEGYTHSSMGQDFCKESEERDNSIITYWSLVSLIGILLCVSLFTTEVGKYKLSVLIFPLYTRLRKENVLNHFVRGQIYGLIRASPGINYMKLKNVLEIGNGALAYHLSVLEKEEYIKSKRVKLNKLFYPTKLSKEQREFDKIYPTGNEMIEGGELSDLQETIIDIIKNNPGITQIEIASKIDKPKQTINYNIKSLIRSEIITIIREGNKSRCYLKGENAREQSSSA